MQIQVGDKIVDNAADWFYWNNTVFSIFPKWEQLNSSSYIVYTVIVSLTQNYQSSFYLNVTLDVSSRVCSQQDIKFTAGVIDKIFLINRVIIANINTFNLNVIENQQFFDAYFNYSENQYSLSVLKTTNSNIGNATVWLVIKDNDGTLYQTNYFYIEVVINYPPTAVYKFNNFIFYQGNLNNMIPISGLLFLNDDNYTLTFKEWFVNNNLIVSFSIPTYIDDNLVSIGIYFANNFIGKWVYEIVDTDSLLQTAIIQINIQVVSWAQKEWILCSGPNQSNWKMCIDGYKLMSDGTCLMIDSTNPFRTTQFLFISIVVILNIVLSIVTTLLNCPHEICNLVIYLNQTMLISWLMSTYLSNDMINFLSILQISKFDLKPLDAIFNARTLVNSLFYKEQYTSLQTLNFESGSTFANFLNTAIVSLIFWTVYWLGMLIVNWEKKAEINVFTKYIQRYLTFITYVSLFKFSFTFVLLNWISELINQISLSESEGDMFSYTITDVLLLIIVLYFIFFHRFKPEKTIFLSETILLYNRVLFIKFTIYSAAFIFNNSSKLPR